MTNISHATTPTISASTGTQATYCTLSNIKDKISSHNAKTLNGNSEEHISCNCQDKTECPIPNECNQTNVIYAAEVKAENKSMNYIGSTENFKARYSVNKSSIYRETEPSNHTTLSSHVWNLKNRKIPWDIKWSIKTKGHAFSSGSRSCDLCFTEKIEILTANQRTALNKRDELLEGCRHRRKHLLVSLKEKQTKVKR